MKSSESTKGSKVSAKKLASKSVKAAAKVAALKEKKIVSAAIKDTHMAGFVNFIREQVKLLQLTGCLMSLRKQLKMLAASQLTT